MPAEKPQHILDLTKGPILPTLLVFSVPVVLSTLLQLAFNAADIIVVGRFATSQALAAVGSNGSIISLETCLVMGLSTGANVMAANFFGAKDSRRLISLVRTAMAIAIAGGLLLGAILVPCSRLFLSWMHCPPEVIGKATVYLQIYLSALPFISIYNFGSAILRAVGDTKRPFIYLTIAGVVNVLLNMLFVIVFHRDADGVAAATAISQAIAGLLVWRAVANTPELGGLRLRNLETNPKMLKHIFAIGVPTALQSTCFSFSNILIQSSINGLGPLAMAGSAASGSVESLTYSFSYSFQQVGISYGGQNLGARKFDRIVRGLLICQALAAVLMISTGLATVFFGHRLLAIYNQDPEVIAWGFKRLKVIQSTYFLCGMMDSLSGNLRGMRHSTSAFALSFVFVCLFRISWVWFVYPAFQSMEMLIASYPISWVLAVMAMACYFPFVIRREKKRGL